jgi:hypothetical protein
MLGLRQGQSVNRIFTKDEAGKIALEMALRARTVAEVPEWLLTSYTIKDAPDRPIPMFDGPLTEPAWYVFVPHFDGMDGNCLRSSHVIVISKVGGRILYDGSAFDEG